MITKLLIDNVKGIKEGAINHLSKINLIVGPNCSGKTTILELLHLFSLMEIDAELTNENIYPTTYAINLLKKHDFFGFDPFSRLNGFVNDNNIIVTKHDRKNVTTETPLPEEHPLSRFNTYILKPFDINSVSTTKLIQLKPNQKYPLREQLIPQNFEKYNVTSENSYWNYFLTGELAHREWNSIDEVYRNPVSTWIVEGKLPEYSVYIDPAVVNNIEELPEYFWKKYWHNIANWEWRIGELLSEIFDMGGKIRKIAILPTTKENGKRTCDIYIEKPGKVPIHTKYWSKSLKHAFLIASSLIAIRDMTTNNETSLILWNQPEMFLNPITLDKLLHKIVQLIKNSGIQIIIATNSIDVLVSFILMIEEGIIDNEELSTIRTKLTNGTLETNILKGTEIVGHLEFIGDPRVNRNEISPLIKFISKRKQTCVE